MRKSETLDRVLPYVSFGLLKEYLCQRGIPFTTADAQSDGDVSEGIVRVVLQAPKAKRDTVLEELEELDESVDDSLIQTLITTARLMRICVPLEILFPKMSSNHERALWTLVNHRHLYDATLSMAATAPLKYHRRRMPPIELTLDDDKVKTLAAVLSKKSRERGLGKGVEPRAYQIGDLSLLVFYLEHAQRKDPNFNGRSEFGYITRRPAYEVVYRYNPTEPALRTYVKGASAAFRREVEEAFTQTMLGIELPPDSEAGRYNLMRFLKEGGAMLDYTGAPDLEKISITSIRLQYFGHTLDDIVLSFQPTAAAQNVDKAIQRAVQMVEENSTPQVAWIRLRAQFNNGLKRKPSAVTFDVTPDGCTLTDKKRHDVLKDLLKKWDIDEQHDPANATGQTETVIQRILQAP